MIQPQELRIGNYVDYKGQMLPVLAIDNEAFLSELKYKGLVRLPDKLPNGMVFGSSGIWCAKINPIPITPEILERCGFSQFKSSVWRNGRLQWVGSLVYLKNEDTDECYYIPTIVDYLHQLQNLYFALTNQELKFKTKNNE